jgi:prophage regulatory protein
MNELDPLLRLPSVVAATGYSRSSIYALVKRDAFPAPVKLAGGGAVAWRSNDVRAWIDAQGEHGAPPTTAGERRQAASERRKAA